MNAIVLRNQGNFGIPLITLLFASSGDDYAISIHMIVLFATNLLLNTIGLYNASSGTYTKKEALLKVFKLPAIYAIILGFLCKGFSIPVIGGIKASLTLAGSGVVPLALFTLGAQLSDAKLKFADKSLPVAVFARLVLSPLIAFGFVKLFGITGTMASVLIIGASAPTAVNSVLLAIEFDGDSEYASEAVFLTTLLSIVTVTITILFTTS